jgi:protoporphyrinogen oxidase
MSIDVEVFVIGAGPAGLTAAYCLTKEIPSVAVIEKDPTYVGGISRTVRYKDFLFDIGGHRFFSKAKEVVDLWQEILPNDFMEILFVSAERLRGAGQSRHRQERGLHALVRLCQSLPDCQREHLP